MAKPSRKGTRVGSAGPALEAGFLASCIGFNLGLAETVLYRDWVANRGRFDLTQRQSAILLLIGANPAISQTGLARFLDTDRATMMAMIDRLEGRGLIERRRAKRDRRAQALFLTADGAKICTDLKRSMRAHEREFAGRFSPKELKTLLAFLSRLHGKY
jgi:DNA-binding MarR family transcriptional regulator